MNYLTLGFGFISGVLVALIAAYVNHAIKVKSEGRKQLEKAEYNLYLKLNDLYQWYFWLAANETHHKETSDDIISTIHKIATEIAQELHKNEDSEFTQDLLAILYDESYETYNERWKAMSALSDRMGKKVAPIHNAYLSKLNDSNLLLMANPDFVSKAPAMSRFKERI